MEKQQEFLDVLNSSESEGEANENVDLPLADLSFNSTGINKFLKDHGLDSEEDASDREVQPSHASRDQASEH